LFKTSSNKLLVLFILLALGCSPYRKNPLSGSFHNITAHYNAYFIAKERIKEIENTIYQGQDWNYDRILPIYPQFDTTTSASLKEELEDCIQKASIAIQRHPGSKWEDDSYILVGKARHYGSEFPDAIETFKYVNTHSENENARHYALTELIRSFTEFEEYNNAVAVTDYLAKEKLSKENQKRLFLNTAYLYQQKGDQDKMVSNLVEAEELYHASDKARINFIIGQLYHTLDFESEAYRYYKNVLKNHPNYELEFYAKLYMAQVTELSESSDLKKIRKYFKGLLADPKNNEYRDKIYFELAGFELKNGNVDKAIENYKLSVKTSTTNARQKAYSYLGLGKIYYDTLNNYRLAKNYYDSTVNTMPKDEEIFESVQKRQEILVDFVKQITTIQTNDSLLHLASLPEDSVMRLATSIVEKERKTKEEKAKKEKRNAIARANAISKDTGENLISTTSTSSTWYFNNENQIAKGEDDFAKKWGDRPLEDNWRRKTKKEVIVQEETETIPNNQISESTGKEEEISIEEEALKMIASIPKTDEDKRALLAEVEIALHNLGNLYNLRLEEDENAIKSFEELLSRFPQTEYKAEVLYQLFLLHKDTNASIKYGQQLKNEFPETIFAKLVDNPNYREESFATSEQLKKLYKKLYDLYEKGMYHRVKHPIDSALSIHPENEFSDNLALLGILATGQLDNERKYQYELAEFIKKYPESDILEYVQSLAKTSESFQQKRYNSGKAKFIKSFNQEHFFVVIYPIEGSLSNQVRDEVAAYLESKNLKNLKTGNLTLSEKNAMIFVNSFPGKGTAINFYKSFMSETTLKDKFKGKKFDIFVITDDNFDIFYRTKDIDSYLNFFQKNYQ